jgi:hypothetical protein
MIFIFMAVFGLVPPFYGYLGIVRVDFSTSWYNTLVNNGFDLLQNYILFGRELLLISLGFGP